MSGHIANTVTTPLTVILYIIAGYFIGDLQETVVVVTALELTGIYFFLCLISRKLFGNRLFAWVAFAGIICNPLLVSTIGLESFLYLLLTVVCCYAFLERKITFLALALALLTMTRPDGVLLFGVSLLFLESGRRRRLIVAYTIMILPWHLFSWVYLGSFLPDTFFLKVNFEGESGRFWTGIPLFLSRYPLEMLLSFWMVILSLFLYFGRANSMVMTLLKFMSLFCLIHFLGYSLLRAPNFHFWYYSLLAASTAIIGALGLACLIESREWSRHNHWLHLAITIIVLLPSLVMIYPKMGDAAYPETPIHSNFASANQYRDIGAWLQQNVSPDAYIALKGETGTLSYYSQRRLVDAWSSRALSNMYYERFGQLNPFFPFLTRFNNVWMDPPQACWPFQYRLISYFEPLSNDEVLRKQSDPCSVVMSWDIFSRWNGRGRIFLLGLPPSPSGVPIDNSIRN
jgi:hypothetical protein